MCFTTQPSHPHWHGNEAKYADLDPSEIPVSESLQDTMMRTIPLWEARILPQLKEGLNVMIVAHANSLRGASDATIRCNSASYDIYSVTFFLTSLHYYHH